MRRNRQHSNIFSHPSGPQEAAEIMVSHLSRVFGGDRRNPKNIRRTASFPEQQLFELANDDTPFEAETIAFIIRKMAPRKAPGNDHITGAMLKPIGHPLSLLLSKLFTLCWKWSYIPTSWRIAQVVPI